MDYMSKSEIAEALAEEGLGGKVQINRILDGLARLASDELEVGNDFLVPGIVKISYSYTPAQAKGSRWKKGDTRVNNITKEESIADADSPAKKANVRLRPSLRGVVGKRRITTSTSANFLKSNAGKAVVARLAK